MAKKTMATTLGRKKPVKTVLLWQFWQQLSVEIEVQPAYTLQEVLDLLEDGTAEVDEHGKVISRWKAGERTVLARLMDRVEVVDDCSSDFEAEAVTPLSRKVRPVVT